MAWHLEDQVTNECSDDDCHDPASVLDFSLTISGPLAGHVVVRGKCDKHAWHGDPASFVYNTVGTGERRLGFQLDTKGAMRVSGAPST